jgi:hypothetical protein
MKASRGASSPARPVAEPDALQKLTDASGEQAQGRRCEKRGYNRYSNRHGTVAAEPVRYLRRRANEPLAVGPAFLSESPAYVDCAQQQEAGKNEERQPLVGEPGR